MVVGNYLRDLLDKENIRGQLYEVPDVFQIPKLINKDMSIESLSTIVQTKEIFDASDDTFVLGHPTNGKLGVANGVGGNQIVLGDHRGATITERVTNPNNTWKDFIRDTYHWDTTNSNATVDTTNHKITF